MIFVELINTKFLYNWESNHEHFKIYHSVYTLFPFFLGTLIHLLLPTKVFVLSKSICIGSATQGDNMTMMTIMTRLTTWGMQAWGLNCLVGCFNVKNLWDTKGKCYNKEEDQTKHIDSLRFWNIRGELITKGDTMEVRMYYDKWTN